MKITLALMVTFVGVSCSPHYVPMQFSAPIQLTSAPMGHTINSTQCFSPDGNWIVCDARNVDGELAASGSIHMVNIQTHQEVLLYRTHNQSTYGPGVGASTFSPDGKKVLFLGGIANADRLRPYSVTRRTGIAVAIDNPLVSIPMDARDISAPFTSGALRGGTHAHSWSGDGQWISFTYNDFVVQQAEKKNPNIQDLRTVGAMFSKPVTVSNADGVENKSGNMFSILITNVTPNPQPGSDEIQKAFDECWVGHDGYLRPDGRHQKRAIAFQGNVKKTDGRVKTEIFVADIPDDLPNTVDNMHLEGTDTTLPPVPAHIVTRRISFLEKGVSDTPRHWLRSLPDGSMIGFLMTDKNDVVQLWGIAPNSGKIEQLTHLKYSIAGPFNFSPDGQYAAFLSDGSVYVSNIKNKKSYRAMPKTDNRNDLVGAVVWSPKGDMLAYNQYKEQNGQKYLQICLLKIH